VSLVVSVEAACRRYEDRPALIDARVEYSYGEMLDRARRLASALVDLGVGKDDCVLICLGNIADYFVIELGVALAGAVRLPTLTKNSPEELRKFIDVTDAKAVFAGGAGVEPARAAAALVEWPIPVILAGETPRAAELELDALIAASRPRTEALDAVADDLNAIRFTGGSVEMPKGVMLSHRSMERMADMMVVNWGFERDDRFLHIHPVTHASGFLAYGYMLRGACNVMQEDFSVTPERVLESFARYGITSTFLVPTLIGGLLDYDGLGDLDTSRLRHIFYGGAPITPARLRAAIDAFGSVLVQIYGSSETSFTLTTLLPSEHEFEGEPPNRLASVGRTVIGAADVRIRAEDGSFLPPGEVGEIVARGDVTMDGYWRNPALSAERKLADGWVLTGDYGSFDADGYLYLTPKRKEDLIITGGFNVWPAEVEAVIEEHPAVVEAAVYAVADDRWGEKVCATVVGPADLADLQDHLRERLVKYKVPKEILLRGDPLPRGEDGAPLRSDLASDHVAASG